MSALTPMYASEPVSPDSCPDSSANVEISSNPSHTALIIRDYNCNNNADQMFSNISLQMLAKLVENENWDNVLQFGGVERIAAELRSDMNYGISGTNKDISCRLEAFGLNIYFETSKLPQLQPLGTANLFILQEFIHIWIFVISVYVLLLSYIIAQGNIKWWNLLVVTTIIFCFVLICYRTAADNFSKARELERLLNYNMEAEVTVMRSHQLKRISSRHVVVGDIVILHKGDHAPADGLLVARNNVLGREKSFVFSGSKVLQEVRMLVTAVGINTKKGKTMSTKRTEFNELRRFHLLFKNLALYKLQALSFLVHLVSRCKHGTGNQDVAPNTNPYSENLTVDTDASQLHAKINHGDIVRLVKEKDFYSLTQYGGVEGVAKVLVSDTERGLNSDARQLNIRRSSFGTNVCPKLLQPKPKGFSRYFTKALFGDTMVGVLLDTFVSISSNSHKDGWRNWWYVALLATVFPFGIATISAMKSYHEAQNNSKLLKQGYSIRVTVLRGGEEQTVSVVQVVVGDIVCLKTGDLIPADGLFSRGHSLCVEVDSSISEDCDSTNVINKNSPFMFAGSKVSNGIANMLVTSVGEETLWHEMMTSLGPTLENHKPLQAQFERLILIRRLVGLVSMFSITVVSLIRCFIGKSIDNDNQDTPSSKLSQIFQMLLLTLIKVLTNIILVNPGSRLGSSVLMGNTKDFTNLVLKLLPITFTKGIKEIHAKDQHVIHCMTTGFVTNIVTDELSLEKHNEVKVSQFNLNGETRMHNLSEVPLLVLDALRQGVCLNRESDVSVNANEKAILSWGVEELGIDMEELKRRWTPLSLQAFSLETKRSGVLIRKTDSVETTHIHWRGDVDSVLPMCTYFNDKDGAIQMLNEEKKMRIEQSFHVMNTTGFLHSMAFAYKPTTKREEQANEESGSPEANKDREFKGEVECKLEEEGFTLLGVVILSQETKAAVAACRNAGINIKLLSRYNITKAKVIAVNYGIFAPGHNEEGMVVAAEDFRRCTSQQRLEMVDKMQVLAGCSSYMDTFLMVEYLKKKGEVVAVTGTGLKDVPALKTADVGFSMGPGCTEVAKESADIIIAGNNFASVAERLIFRRHFNTFVQKLVQLECSGNITSFVVNFIALTSLGETPLNDFRMFWLNFFTIVIGNFTLVESLFTEEVVKKPTFSRNVLVATKFMWRNIIFQASYQSVALVFLVLKGQTILGGNKHSKKALVYNTLFLCQFLHMLNARDLEKKNVFQGILRSWLFCGLMGISIFIHVVMLVFWPKYFDVGKLNWGQWGLCLGIAVVSWFFGLASKCITEGPAFLPLVNRHF